MFEYEAEVRFTLDEEMFEGIMGRGVGTEEEWNAFCDAMIDAAYEGIEHSHEMECSKVEQKVNAAADNDWMVV